MSPHQPRILLVEDQPEQALLIRLWLEKDLDVEVVTATTAGDAFLELSKGGISLILSDIELPGMSGLDFARTVRSKEPNVTIVLMTAHSRLGLCDVGGCECR